MYDVALSVLSCLRAGTDVHVAWVVSPTSDKPGEAVAITPGGGRMGSLLGGALDDAITEAIRGLEDGRLVEVSLGPVEALISGQPEGTALTLAADRGERPTHRYLGATDCPQADPLCVDHRRQPISPKRSSSNLQIRVSSCRLIDS